MHSVGQSVYTECIHYSTAWKNLGFALRWLLLQPLISTLLVACLWLWDWVYAFKIWEVNLIVERKFNREIIIKLSLVLAYRAWLLIWGVSALVKFRNRNPSWMLPALEGGSYNCYSKLMTKIIFVWIYAEVVVVLHPFTYKHSKVTSTCTARISQKVVDCAQTTNQRGWG